MAAIILIIFPSIHSIYEYLELIFNLYCFVSDDCSANSIYTDLFFPLLIYACIIL